MLNHSFLTLLVNIFLSNNYTLKKFPKNHVQNSCAYQNQGCQISSFFKEIIQKSITPWPP
ncbi:hypothetical protein HanPSC8_Chr15g0654991 [Helianthus annuus]|nr:hypothetical protein HanPSC8_Chr15g0654991 [Helianthus annuus]